MAERSEAKSAKRSFASKYFKFAFLTRSFASRFLLRFAQPFLAKFKWTINWSLSPQGLGDEIKEENPKKTDINSIAHYTVAPVQSELVKLDLLEGTYLNSSKRLFHGQPTSRSLPPPPALPSALQNSSHSSSISVMSNGDYRDR